MRVYTLEEFLFIVVVDQPVWLSFLAEKFMRYGNYSDA